MSQVLKCKPNVPEEIALKFPDGINVSGQYGNQVLYTLADNRKLYLPPIVAEKIKELKVVPEEQTDRAWKSSAVGGKASGPACK